MMPEPMTARRERGKQRQFLKGDLSASADTGGPALVVQRFSVAAAALQPGWFATDSS